MRSRQDGGFSVLMVAPKKGGNIAQGLPDGKRGYTSKHSMVMQRLQNFLQLNRLPLAVAGALLLLGLHLQASTWIVAVDAGTDARQVAQELGASYRGPLAGVAGHHRMAFPQPVQARPGEPTDNRAFVRSQLASSTKVTRFEEEVIFERFPRQFVPADPLFPDQWHLENIGQSGGLVGSDVNARPAWDEGLSGAGVTVAIVDEGIQFQHPDLQPNWWQGSGYDYNDDDFDPSPVGADDRHGTTVAGITLAASNDREVLGIAHAARLVPLRLIAGPYESGEEAEALSYRRDSVDIYNNSWGPSDEAGVRFADSSQTLKVSLRDNVFNGRGGRGNIYVWAAGNGGLNGDNSNYDGYNALPYTISVGALGHDDIKAGYSEPGSNLLVVAPSGGRGAGILTTDNTGPNGYVSGNTYSNFSGTSAAAPAAAGVVALMLEARPELTWRDVQAVLALTAVPVDLSGGEWIKNSRGLLVSHDYGFGRVDAGAAVSLARDWQLLGSLMETGRSQSSQAQLQRNVTRSSIIEIESPMEVQFVNVTVNLSHNDWGDLLIEIISPEGTRRTLSNPHSNANRSGQPGSWTFLSTQHLGESAQGFWRLEVTDTQPGSDNGVFNSWSLQLMGGSPVEGIRVLPQLEDLAITEITFPVELDLMEGVDGLEILSVQNPPFGEIQSLGDGKFRYRMIDSKDGRDQFSVLYHDGTGRVTRRVVEVLDPRPVGNNDFFPLASGGSFELPVLANDLDPLGLDLELQTVASQLGGRLQVQGSQVIYQAPASERAVVERFQYSLRNTDALESSAWVTVVAQPTNEVVLQFDGVDDFLTLSSYPALEDRFTVEAWIYPEDWGEYVTGFGRIYDSDTFVFFLNGFDHSFYNDRSLVAYLVLDDGDAVAINTLPGTIDLNRWQHIALSFDSSDRFSPVRIYIDGVQQNLNLPIDGSSLPRVPIANNGGELLYMGESSSGARAFKGRMGDFRIWNEVRTLAQITAKKDQVLSGSEAGLGLYLPLNVRLDTAAENTAGTGALATISGALRVPRELPWQDFVDRYDIIEDAENGWWEDRTLGWISGDLYPWVYLPALGWVYSDPEGRAPNDYRLYPIGNDWGWLGTSSNLYPWFLRYLTGGWLWYFPSTEPPWFYSSDLGDWFLGTSTDLGTPLD
jgi:subtilisin family serine protease